MTNIIDTGTTTPDGISTERSDLIQALGLHRRFLLQTANGLTDEQATTRSTVSELTIAGIVKHVTAAESAWADFIETGVQSKIDGIDWEHPDPAAFVAWQNEFRLLEGETVADVVAAYRASADRTDALLATVPDLDRSYPLPAAPWFPPGAAWTVRQAALHILAETSQHAGHADIIREAIDGAKTMG